MWKIKSLVAGLALVVGISGCAGEKRPSYPMEKPLLITIKDNQPCFYVEYFNGIDEFTLTTFGIYTTNRNMIESKNMWGNYLPNSETIRPFKLALLKGKNNCIKYATKDSFILSQAKNLKINTLYSVFINGKTANAHELGTRDWSNSPQDNNWIEIRSNFYLSKNKSTNQLEVIIVKDSEVDNWLDKHINNKLGTKH
jgi:hypothetical protein